MVVITNPGSNMPAALVERFGIVMTPQQISVDGVLHDTRTIQSLATVDELVRKARQHPFVLGTSAGEYVAIFRDIGRQVPELLAVMTSRKLIGSYDAAHAALRTLATIPGRGPSVSVLDSRSTDVACGLVTLFCAAAAHAGHPMSEVVAVAERFATNGFAAFLPVTIDYLVKGGRASFLKGLAADLIGVSPLLALVDGEIKSAGRVSRRDDMAVALADAVIARVGAGRPVWAAVSHGNSVVTAMAVAARLRERLDVRYMMVQTMAPAIYLHGGAGGLCAAAYPIDGLPWVPKLDDA